MNREPYLQSFAVGSTPRWKCPFCEIGHLTLAEKDFTHVQTAASLLEQEEEESDFDWIKYRFACILYCDQKTCKEPVSCIGEGHVTREEWKDRDGDHSEYHAHYTPKFFVPELNLMDLPVRCPPEVREHLESSFGMFFSNPAAAMNAARISLEALMDHLKVATESSSGKRLTLHARVDLIPAPYDVLKDNFKAVKWLGNAGSHAGDKPTAADVAQMYDIFEHALAKIFDDTDHRIKEMVKQVNLAKGIPPPKPSWESF